MDPRETLHTPVAPSRAINDFGRPQPSDPRTLRLLLAADLEAERFPIPPLPAALVELNAITRSGDPDLRAACRIVERDATLAGRVVAVASSVAYGVAPARDLAQAVGRLGTIGLRDISYALLLHEMFPVQGRFGLWMQQENARAYPLARAAQATFKGLALDASLGFLAGLLADVGRMALIAMLARYPAAEDVDEDRLLGVIDGQHCEIGQLVLTRWALAPELVAVAVHHHTPDAAAQSGPEVQAAALAVTVRDTLELVEDADEALAALATLPMVERACLDDEELARIVRVTSEALAAPLG